MSDPTSTASPFLMPEASFPEPSISNAPAPFLAPVVVYHCDRDLRYTWIVNPHPDFKPEQVLGKRDDEILPEPEVREFLAFKQRVLGTGIGEQQRIGWNHKGQLRLFDLTAEPIRDLTGAILGLTVAAYEAAPQEPAPAVETAALASQEVLLLDAVLNALPDAIFIADRSGALIKMNPAAEKLWGGPLPRALTIDGYREYRGTWKASGQPVQPYEWAMARALAEKKLFTGDIIEIERFDGSQTTIYNSAAPILDAKGEVLGGIAAAMDISAQLEIEAALKVSEERLRVAAQVAGIGIWDTHEVGSFTSWDTRCKEIFGFAPEEEITPDAFRECVHGDDWESVQKARTAALDPQGTGDYRTEFRINRKNDGAPCWVAVQGKAVFTGEGENRKAARFTGAILEMTRLKTNEDKLKKAMTETHHRVGNSFQLLCALIDLKKMAHQGEAISGEFERLTTHVQSMAAVHRLLMDESEHDPEASSVSAKSILERMMPLLEKMSGLPLQIGRLDEARLLPRQGTSLALVTNELIMNALKFGHGEVKVDFIVEGQSAMLSVSDNGPGLPADFDPASLANTGLNLMETVGRWDLNGETRYENQAEGTGAKVSIRFPLVDR